MERASPLQEVEEVFWIVGKRISSSSAKDIHMVFFGQAREQNFKKNTFVIQLFLCMNTC